LLITTIIASSLDSGGDVGTQMARSTILMNLFPVWGTAERQNILLLILIGVALGAFVILFNLKRCMNQAAIATFGSITTLVVQVILATNTLGIESYLAFWHAGKLFGFLSTFSSGLMIAAVSPVEHIGFWNGLNAGLTNTGVGLSQIIFSRVYDSNNDGSAEGRRGMYMLVCTSVISFLSVFAYGGLIAVWPKEVDEKKKKKDDADFEDLAKWEKLTDKEWSALPMETVDKVSMRMMDQGKHPRIVNWGDYQGERAEISSLRHRARADFEYVTKDMRDILANRPKMLEMQKMMKTWEEMTPKVDREKAKQEMGAWIADYFDDAGYINWEKQAPIYKSMLLSAFPPVDDLDDLKPDYATMPIDQYEDAMMKFLAVMDSHLNLEKTRNFQKLSTNFFGGLLQRR